MFNFSGKEKMSSSESSEKEHQEEQSKPEPEQQSETKSKNASKKAQHFDFEAILQKTLHDQQARNAQTQAAFVDATREERDVEERLAAVTLPGGHGRNNDADAKGPDGAALNDEDEDDIGPALPPGFVPDKSVQISDPASRKAEDDDDEDVTVSSLIPATYESKIIHGQKAVLALAFDAQGSKFVTGGQNYAIQFFDFLKMDSSMKPFREVYPAES